MSRHCAAVACMIQLGFLKDMCYAWSKNSTNQQLLDILTYKSANKPYSKILTNIFCKYRVRQIF